MTLKKQFSILVIDDDPNLLSILNQASRSGFPKVIFHQVYSTAEAICYLDGLQGAGPKLILLDISIGNGANGSNLLRLLRANPQTRLLSVVILTAAGSHQVIRMAYSDGAAAFTVKPIELSAWTTYLHILRRYWLDTVSLPKINFRRQ